MRIRTIVLHLVLGAAWLAPAWAQSPQPVLITPEAVKWGPAPPSVPPGAQVALLAGDPGKPGPFTIRVKLPDGWTLPPHTHPIDERATVLQGTLLVGTGATWEESTLVALPAGSFRLTPAGVPHYLRARGETIFQVDGVGPNAITYSNPADDPRRH